MQLVESRTPAFQRVLIVRFGALGDMVLLRHGRLSVQPVTASEWRHIESYCRGKE